MYKVPSHYYAIVLYCACIRVARSEFCVLPCFKDSIKSEDADVILIQHWYTSSDRRSLIQSREKVTNS